MEKKTSVRDDVVVLATYNTRVPCDKPPNDWASRRDRVLKVVRDDCFDIFGVQEMVHDQIADMVADGVFGWIGGGRDDFKDMGEHCCIFYRKDRFGLEAGGTFGISEKPDEPGVRSWGTACPRIATWGRFVDNATGRKFVYYNTHLDHVSELAREEGIKLVVRHAAGNSAGLPLVLTGDFNAYPDSETYRVAAELLRDSRAISRTGHKGPDTTWHGWGAFSGPDVPIDFIFVSDGVEVLSHVTDDVKPDGQFASDHFPVIASLVFPSQV